MTTPGPQALSRMEEVEPMGCGAGDCDVVGVVEEQYLSRICWIRGAAMAVA